MPHISEPDLQIDAFDTEIEAADGLFAPQGGGERPIAYSGVQNIGDPYSIGSLTTKFLALSLPLTAATLLVAFLMA